MSSLPISLQTSMKRSNADNRESAYKVSGVDTDEAEAGIKRLTSRIRGTWPSPGQFGEVKLPIGYFANVVDVGGMGIALCTDGVGSKALIASMMRKYDTVGIDCVAMNVNDVICVGARPVSMVDYIAIDRANASILEQLSIGLTEGARQGGVSISGGEISQLKGMVSGFDLVGMAIGHVDLDKILIGQNIRPGDTLIGIESNGLHSNGYTLARRAFFEQNNYSLSHRFDELPSDLGTELLRPTHIYVKEGLEILEKVPSTKALVHITSDGFLNLTRVQAAIGYVIDALPPIPPIFSMIERLGDVKKSEMFEVYNMGIGFCIVVASSGVDDVLAILKQHGRRVHKIGYVTDDPQRHVILEQHQLIGQGKRFWPMR